MKATAPSSKTEHTPGEKSHQSKQTSILDALDQVAMDPAI